MRFRDNPARFRTRAEDDMRIVMDASSLPSLRLAHLIAVVYQIRCNLFHGQKNPADFRRHKLIRSGDRILDGLLNALLNRQ